jgi:aspartokinase/homoserine dehydrogenase 1
MQTKVIKFGGTIFNQADGFQKFLEIILNADSKLIIVISAFGQTTRNLKNCGLTAMNKSFNQSIIDLQLIIDYHKNICFELINNNDILIQFNNIIDDIGISISKVLEGISLINEISPRILDKLLSFGELLAINTISFILNKKNISHSTLNNELLIVTDNNFGRAIPQFEETSHRINKLLLPELDKNNLIITQGYAAISVTGEKTTMGIESSNLTAVMICSCLNIQDLVIISDVEGVRTADPKIINTTKLIETLTYKNAYNYSISGLKLIYPEMVKIAERSNIKIAFSSVDNNHFTFIHSNENVNHLPILILKKKLLKIEIPINDENLLKIISEFKNNIVFSEIVNDKYQLLIDFEYTTNKKLLNKYEIDKNIDIVIIENINKNNFESIIHIINSYKNLDFQLLNISFSENEQRAIINFKISQQAEFLNLLHTNLINI